MLSLFQSKLQFFNLDKIHQYLIKKYLSKQHVWIVYYSSYPANLAKFGLASAYYIVYYVVGQTVCLCIKEIAVSGFRHPFGYRNKWDRFHAPSLIQG